MRRPVAYQPWVAILAGLLFHLNCSSPSGSLPSDPEEPSGGQGTLGGAGGTLVAGVAGAGGGSAGAAGVLAEGGTAGAAGGGAQGGSLPHCEEDPLEVYQRRIEPLLVDDNPKTCNQCHLSGVDLGKLVRESPCETMACLVHDGLVDLSAPDESKILEWIRRASPESALITEQVIEAEYTGFLEWIESSASCTEACAGVTCGDSLPAEVCPRAPSPRELASADETGCDDLTLERRFYADVYAWRGRCYPCHFDDQPNAVPTATRWVVTDGNCDLASLRTLRRVAALGFIDVREPAQSLLLVKPLAESSGGVKHGGGDKFHDADDLAYQSFLRFIEHYAGCEAQGVPAP
ncbi:MAG TPA: hypothetical protein VER33_19250 [Polyangiaceae bacterium]|nr:hypothetical protein [Polyangiaceae bacterium]